MNLDIIMRKRYILENTKINTEILKAIETVTYRNDMLKLFAMLTMLIDHIGYMFFPEYQIFRTIGRLAFPIFAYQLSVGYMKTSNLKKYASRLLGFALISQIPYSFFSPNLEFKPFNLNIMFTLLSALGILYVYDIGIAKIGSFKSNKNYTELFFAAASFLGVFAMLIAPELLEIISNRKFRLEYGVYGLFMILLFHIYKDKKAPMVISYVLLSLFYAYFTAANLLAANSFKSTWTYLFSFGTVWKEMIYLKSHLPKHESIFFQSRSIFALIPIYTFQLSKIQIKINKYIGYLFYPVHITILLVIAKFI